MANAAWKGKIKFFEGMITSIGAGLAYWLAMESINMLWQLLGHVAGNVVLQMIPWFTER